MLPNKRTETGLGHRLVKVYQCNIMATSMTYIYIHNAYSLEINIQLIDIYTVPNSMCPPHFVIFSPHLTNVNHIHMYTNYLRFHFFYPTKFLHCLYILYYTLFCLCYSRSDFHCTNMWGTELPSRFLSISFLQSVFSSYLWRIQQYTVCINP